MLTGPLQLSLGKPEPGVDVKLSGSDGSDGGEILIKSSFVFSGYVYAYQ